MVAEGSVEWFACESANRNRAGLPAAGGCVTTKNQLLNEIGRLRQEKDLYKTCVQQLKKGAGEQIDKGQGLNPLWVYEKATNALAKAEMI